MAAGTWPEKVHSTAARTRARELYPRRVDDSVGAKGGEAPPEPCVYVGMCVWMGAYGCMGVCVCVYV